MIARTTFNKKREHCISMCTYTYTCTQAVLHFPTTYPFSHWNFTCRMFHPNVYEVSLHVCNWKPYWCYWSYLFVFHVCSISGSWMPSSEAWRSRKSNRLLIALGRERPWDTVKIESNTASTYGWRMRCRGEREKRVRNEAEIMIKWHCYPPTPLYPPYIH